MTYEPMISELDEDSECVPHSMRYRVTGCPRHAEVTGSSQPTSENDTRRLVAEMIDTFTSDGGCGGAAGFNELLPVAAAAADGGP